MRRWWMISGVAVIGLALSGCPEDPAPTDAGGGGTDGGATDAGPSTETPPPTAGTGDDRDALDALNLACTPTAPPTDGAASTFDLRVEDFQDADDTVVVGLNVQFFSDNTIPGDGSCPSATCTEGTSDSGGLLSGVSSNEGAWYAYRLEAGMATLDGTESTYIQVVQYNEPTPADGMAAVANAVRASTSSTITSLLGISQDDANGIVTGEVSDCDGNPVANARVRIFNSDGQIPFGAARTATQSFYYRNGLPAAAEYETNTAGLYGVANVPIPSDGQVRVEIWAVLTDGGEMEMIGCENVSVVPNGITIINVGPTRSDGPTTCSG